MKFFITSESQLEGTEKKKIYTVLIDVNYVTLVVISTV